MPRKKRSSSPFELMDDDFDDTSSQSSRSGNPPVQRNAANARERARMRVLSSAFGRLKTKLPNIPADTKLSKLDTLRLATMYIKQLKSVVEGGAAFRSPNGEYLEKSLHNHANSSTNCCFNFNMGVQSMNWPFGFHHHLSSSPVLRANSSTSLISNYSNNSWCTREDNICSNIEEQFEPALYENENYDQHHEQQPLSFINHTTVNPPNNHRHNNWFSEPPSPELDSTTSTCLVFENSHHHNHHNVSHSQPASTQFATAQLQHNFHHHTERHQPSVAHHLPQNSIR